MKRKRIHNDIKVTWVFLQDGLPYMIDQEKSKVYLHSPFGKSEISDFVVSENVIEWTFYGKDQKLPGKYSLTLSVNEGEEGMLTIDKCNFVELVSCSCKEGGSDECNVRTESIELVSTISLCGGGGGSYDDTKIKQDIADLQAKDEATDAELAELSADVDNISALVIGKPIEKTFNVTGYHAFTSDTILANIKSGTTFNVGLFLGTAVISNWTLWVKYKGSSDFVSVMALPAATEQYISIVAEQDIVELGAAISSSYITTTGYVSLKLQQDSIVEQLQQNVQELSEEVGELSNRVDEFLSDDSETIYESKFNVTGYHGPGQDTIVQEIAEGQSFQVALNLVSAQISYWTLWVRYEGETSFVQFSAETFNANEYTPLVTSRKIVELSAAISSAAIQSYGDVVFSLKVTKEKEESNIEEIIEEKLTQCSNAVRGHAVGSSPMVIDGISPMGGLVKIKASNSGEIRCCGRNLINPFEGFSEKTNVEVEVDSEGVIYMRNAKSDSNSVVRFKTWLPKGTYSINRDIANTNTSAANSVQMIKPDGGVLNINQDSRTFDASADGEYTFAVTTKIYPSYTAEIRICLVVGTTGIPFVAASQPQVVNADANGNAECNATSTAMTLFAAEGTTLVAEFNKDINSVIGSIPTEVLSNKSIVVDGDSITEGVGNSPYKGWAEYIAESFNMSLTNSAKAGATIATGTKDSLGNNWRWLCESVANLLPSDYVIVSGGYNDYANSVPMGEYANEIESNPNTATFYGACEKMCQNLINNFTTKKIGFVFTHKITDSWYRANSQGKTMIDYHDALVKVLNKYCIPYCDLFNDGQFNTAIPSLQGYAVSPIGVHPNDMGYRLFYVDKIKAFLKNL